MSDTLKVRLISWANTFVSAFLLTVAASLTLAGSVEWTTSFWVGLAMTGVRAGIAELLKQVTPVRLGGKR